MANVPSNLIPSRISQLPQAPVADPAGYFPITISGTTYKVQFSQILGNVEVPASRRIDTGTGLTGGGSLSANLTIAVANGGIGNDQLDTTGVAAGTYGSSTAIPVVTVNTKARMLWKLINDACDVVEESSTYAKISSSEILPLR